MQAQKFDYLIPINAFKALKPLLSKDANRHTITGYHLKIEGGAGQIEATNGRILGVVYFATPMDLGNYKDLDIIIPGDFPSGIVPAEKYKKELTQVQFNETNSMLRVSFKSYKGSVPVHNCKTEDSWKYPNTGQVIPKEENRPEASAYNARFLTDAFKMFDVMKTGAVKFATCGQSNPLVAEALSEDSTYGFKVKCILMPMRAF